MSYYLYIDRTTLEMVKCSPVNKPNDKLAVIEVEDALGSQLAAGQIHELQNYFVTTEDGEFVLQRREVVLQVAAHKMQAGGLREISKYENADCVIVINNNAQTLTIRLDRLFGKPSATFACTDISDNKDTFNLYVTKKNDPTYLLFSHKVPLGELIKNVDGVTLPLPVDCTNVSVYTKQIATSYSLEITND